MADRFKKNVKHRANDASNDGHRPPLGPDPFVVKDYEKGPFLSLPLTYYYHSLGTLLEVQKNQYSENLKNDQPTYQLTARSTC